MATEIQGIYDTTHQQLKAMSQMWNFEQYNQNSYASVGTANDKFDPLKSSENMMFHPFFGTFAQMPPAPMSTTPSDRSRTPSLPAKKKPQPVPEEQKDENYRERRRRNNEAARKSREQRKRNEDNISRRYEDARNENLFLRQEVHRLTMEMERLQYVITGLTARLNLMSSTNHPPPPPNPPSY